MALSARWISKSAVGLVCLVGAACSDAVPTQPESDGPAFTFGGSDTQCGTYQPVFTRGTSPWPCNSEIQVLTNGGGDQAALDNAVDEWNSIRVTGMPNFVTATKAMRITALGVSTDTSVKGVWGGTRGAAGTVSISLAAGTGTGSGTRSSVALHEFGHIMGLENVWDGGAYRTTGVSDHCTSSFTGPGQTYTKSTFCQHLVEYFLFAYGVRPTEPSWNKHIVTGLQVVDSVGLLVGTDQMLTVTHMLFDRQNAALCTESCDLPLPAASLAWYSTNPSVVTVTTSGNNPVLHPVAPGSARVYAAMSAASFELGSQVRDIKVTVTNPPRPDLVPGPLSLHGEAARGVALQFDLVQYNQGPAPSTGTWSGRLLLSTDSIPSANDTLLYQYTDSRTIPAANPNIGNGFTQTAIPFTIPATMPLGNYYYIAQLDVGSAITEASETNNVRVQPVTVRNCVWPGRANPLIGGGAITVAGSGSCFGRYLKVMTSGNRAGFSSTCANTGFSKSYGFSLWGCSVGSASLNVYLDAALTQLEKTISVSVTLEPIE